jgi:hypothetical protein
MTGHDEHPDWLKAWTAGEPPQRPEESRYAVEARQALTEHTLGAYERALVLAALDQAMATRELAAAVRRVPDRPRRRWWQL